MGDAAAWEDGATTVPDAPAPAVAPSAWSGGLLGLQRVAGNRAVLASILRMRSGSTSAGPGGGEAAPEVEDRIRSSRRRGGSRLDRLTRGRMEPALGRDLGDVTIHADAEADTLNRSLVAEAFTVGSDIWFRRGAYQPETSDGQELLAHELTHVAQQDGAVHRRDVVRRHSSWEHKMLGDVSPDDLELIVRGRDKKRTNTLLGEADSLDSIDEIFAGGTYIEQGRHVLETQIQVLEYLRAQDRSLMYAQEEDVKALTVGLSMAPNVKLVPVRLSDGTAAILTYGEVNTLADYYGDLDELRQTDAENFRRIVRGVRERELRGFTEFLTEMDGGDAKKAKYDDKLSFGDAIGDTGRKSSMPGVKDAEAGELALMGVKKFGFDFGGGGRNTKLAVEGRPDTSYTAGLARNACHFAPYSWHAWAKYHAEALEIARAAFECTVEAVRAEFVFDDAEEAAEAKERHTREAELLLQDAMLTNGFGDHFLQDSFASGHLINKTLIMKWFVEWLDTQPWKRDFASDDDWRRVQAAVYGQGEALSGRDLYGSDVSEPSNDPQSAEIAGGTWQQRFEALGLQIPASLRGTSLSSTLFRRWQAGIELRESGRPENSDISPTLGVPEDKKQLYADATMSLRDLEQVAEMRGAVVQRAVLGLVQDGVIVVEGRPLGHIHDTQAPGGAEEYGLRDEFTMRKDYLPHRKPPKGEAHDLALRAVTQGDFDTFLNRTYLQAATNALHDKFCREGLEVSSQDAVLPMKVYGDNAMLDAGAAEGVKYSAETARMSLDAIMQMADGGRVAPELSTTAISRRFPQSVWWEQRKISLEGWHADGGPLRELCETDIFPAFGVTMKGSLGNATLAAKLTQGNVPHQPF